MKAFIHSLDFHSIWDPFWHIFGSQMALHWTPLCLRCQPSVTTNPSIGSFVCELSDRTSDPKGWLVIDSTPETSLGLTNSWHRIENIGEYVEYNAEEMRIACNTRHWMALNGSQSFEPIISLSILLSVNVVYIQVCDKSVIVWLFVSEVVKHCKADLVMTWWCQHQHGPKEHTCPHHSSTLELLREASAQSLRPNTCVSMAMSCLEIAFQSDICKLNNS